MYFCFEKIENAPTLVLFTNLKFDYYSNAQSATLQKSIRLGLEAALPISAAQWAVKDSFKEELG